jgi:hypothetical protein
MRLSRLLLVGLLVPAFLGAQVPDDCPDTFPPDACQDDPAGVTPVPAPTPVPALDCPCYELDNLLTAYDGCGGTNAKLVALGYIFLSCEVGSVTIEWLSLNDADSCEVQTDVHNIPTLVAGEIAITSEQNDDCIAIGQQFDALRP